MGRHTSAIGIFASRSELALAIADRRAKKRTYQQIADELGVALSTVWRIHTFEMDNTVDKSHNNRELTDRTRRIETRLTKLMLHMGVDPLAERAEFRTTPTGSCVIVPSPHISLKEILDNIPETWNGPVDVFIGERHITTLSGRGNRR